MLWRRDFVGDNSRDIDLVRKVRKGFYKGDEI
jgi:hypothetical protein